MVELFRIEIPKYIIHVLKSKARKATYYTKLKDVPKKYLESENKLKEGYRFKVLNPKHKKQKTVLFEGDKPLIKNTAKIGEPSYYLISGNLVYAGDPWARAKIVEALHEFFVEELKKHDFSSLKYPLIFESELHTTPRNYNWDLDNFGSIYCKVFQDTLKNEKLIPDDSIRYITKPASAPLFVPITEWEDRKIVIILYHDNRQILKDYDY